MDIAENDVHIRIKETVYATTRYILAVLQQDKLTKELHKKTKQEIIQIARSQGVDFPLKGVQHMSKNTLIHCIVEFRINRKDDEAALELLGIDYNANILAPINYYLEKQ